MGRIRCVLGDRSVFFTEGLRAILRQSPVATIIGATQSPTTCRHNQCRPDACQSRRLQKVATRRGFIGLFG